MNQNIFIEKLEQAYLANVNISKKKNSDYAGKNTQDAFANFRMIEHLTQGKVTTEQGIITRMTDKLIRVSNLLNQEAAVVDEKIGDTLSDLANYAIILKIYIEQKQNK